MKCGRSGVEGWMDRKRNGTVEGSKLSAHRVLKKVVVLRRKFVECGCSTFLSYVSSMVDWWTAIRDTGLYG